MSSAATKRSKPFAFRGRMLRCTHASVLRIPPNGKQRCGGARSTCSGGQWDREVPPSRVSIRAFITNLVPTLYWTTLAPRALRVCSFAAGRMGGGGRCYIRGEAPLPFLNPGQLVLLRPLRARHDPCHPLHRSRTARRPHPPPDPLSPPRPLNPSPRLPCLRRRSRRGRRTSRRLGGGAARRRSGGGLARPGCPGAPACRGGGRGAAHSARRAAPEACARRCSAYEKRRVSCFKYVLRRITACKVLFLCYCMYQLPFEPANTCC